ncbi:MAG: phosphatase PAP2 family protein [Opitutae bacterium]|nr:phosphatase PAP2 family protein [Opitutae bacterium]
MKLPALLRAVLALAAAAGAPAAEPAPAPGFFNAAAFDWRPVLAPPPAPDSIAAQGERELAAALDAARTPEQAALAKRYEKFDEFSLMAPVLGEWCTAQNLPRTHAIFQQVYRETRPAVDAPKAAWNRPRPYMDNPALHPAVEKPANASYPSGHGYTSSFYAAVLTAAFPEHAAEWDKQAALVRWSRVVGGAHYPSDVVAGKILGEAVARELLRSPKLQQAIAEIRAEAAPFLRKKAA